MILENNFLKSKTNSKIPTKTSSSASMLFLLRYPPIKVGLVTPESKAVASPRLHHLKVYKKVAATAEKIPKLLMDPATREKRKSDLKYLRDLHAISFAMITSSSLKPFIKVAVEVLGELNDSLLTLDNILENLSMQGQLDYKNVLALFIAVYDLNNISYQRHQFFIQKSMALLSSDQARVSMLNVMADKINLLATKPELSQDGRGVDPNLLYDLYKLEFTIHQFYETIRTEQTITPEQFIEINKAEEIYLTNHLRFQAARLELDSAIKEYNKKMVFKESLKVKVVNPGGEIERPRMGR